LELLLDEAVIIKKNIILFRHQRTKIKRNLIPYLLIFLPQELNTVNTQTGETFFLCMYQRKKNNGVVWLNEESTRPKKERKSATKKNFSKIYRYLINSKLIDNKTLKESLIIALTCNKRKRAN
jgi:hypothetical protein